MTSIGNRSGTPPDVLIVASHLGHGGTQAVICRLANAWVQSGQRIRILLMEERRNNSISLDPRIETRVLVTQSLDWAPIRLRSFLRVVAWVRALRLEISASRTPLVLSFIHSVNVQVLLSCLGLNRPRIVVCERSDPTRQNLGSHWRFLAKMLYRNADLVTANSRGAVANLAKTLTVKRVAFVPNPLPKRQDTEAINTNAPTIVISGRLIALKGHDTLFDAFAKVRHSIPEWRIVVLGDGPRLEMLQAQARNTEIDDAITWYGHVADPFPHYRAAAIFVLPSLFEGMPNALIEAMSCGIAAIVSDASPGPQELINHGKNGLVFETGNSDALADALLKLANNPELRRRLGAAAKRKAQEYEQDYAIQEWNSALGIISPNQAT